MKNRKLQLMHYRVVTPLHTGSSGDIGYIDMPIQREKHTSFPKIEGSSIKGAFRSYFREKLNEKLVNEYFGKEDGKDYASALSFIDAKLLFFPVRVLKGTYLLATCPLVLNRYFNDIDLIMEGKNIEKINITNDKCFVFNKDNLINENCVIIEDLCLTSYDDKRGEFVKVIDPLEKQIQDINNKAIIVSDDVFKYLTTLHTEIITRNKIDPQTGTTEDGGLFNEEYLPSESILYSIVIASKSFADNSKTAEKIISDFNKRLPEIIQIGGNMTIGKGLVELIKVGDSK